MAATQTDHPLERLIFFSDAVFAISITLLIIEIHPPHPPSGSGDAAHWQALAGLIPNFIGFIISFAVIGAFWAGHHRAFSLASHYHPRVLGWNLALLAAIVFMPFATVYLSTNISQRVPTLIYCGTLLVASILNYQCNRIATSPPMVAPEAAQENIDYVRRRGISVMLGAATALIVTLFVPPLGQLGLISIPIWRAALARMGGARAPAASAG